MEVLDWKELMNIVVAIAAAEFSFSIGLASESIKLPEQTRKVPLTMQLALSSNSSGQKGIFRAFV